MKHWQWAVIGVMILSLDVAFVASPGVRALRGGDASGWILLAVSVVIAVPCFWLIWTKGIDRRENDA